MKPTKSEVEPAQAVLTLLKSIPKLCQAMGSFCVFLLIAMIVGAYAINAAHSETATWAIATMVITLPFIALIAGLRGLR